MSIYVELVATTSCDTRTAFSIVESAGLYSQATGAVGALTFSVLAIGFATGIEWRSPMVRLGYRSLVVAFASLIVTSVLWGLIAGTERVSTRASLLAVTATWATSVDGLLLGVACALLIGGKARRKTPSEVLKTTSWLYDGAALFGSILVWSSVSNTLTTAAGRGWYSSFYLFFGIGAVSLVAARSYRLLHSRPSQFLTQWGLTLCMGATIIVLALFAVVAAVPVGARELRVGSYCGHWIGGWTAWLTATAMPAFVAVIGVLAALLPEDAKPGSRTHEEGGNRRELRRATKRASRHEVIAGIVTRGSDEPVTFGAARL